MPKALANQPAVLRLMQDLRASNTAAREAMDLFDRAIAADEIDGIFASGARFVEELYREYAQRTSDVPVELLQGVTAPSHLFPFAVCHSLLANGDPAAAAEVLREHTPYPEGFVERYPAVGGLSQAIAEGDYARVVFRLEDHIGSYGARSTPQETPVDEFDYEKALRKTSRADLEKKHGRILATAVPGSHWEMEIYGRDDSFWPARELADLCAEFAGIGEFERAEQVAGEVLAEARSDEEYLPHAVNAYARIGVAAALVGREEVAVESFRRTLGLVDEAVGKGVADMHWLRALSLALDAMEAVGRRGVLRLVLLSEPLFGVVLRFLSRAKGVGRYDLARYGIPRKLAPILFLSDAVRLFEALRGLPDPRAATLALEVLALHDPGGLAHSIPLLDRIEDVHLFGEGLFQIAYECSRLGDRPSLLLLLPRTLLSASLFAETVRRTVPLHDVRPCWRRLLETERSFRTDIAGILTTL